jgi:release factor glutamine methyltransferase
MNSKVFFNDLLRQLSEPKDPEEQKNTLLLALENLMGLTYAQVLAEKEITVTGDEQSRLTSIIHRLNQHQPIQYILGEAWFYGRKFKVNPSVLIPRPETELLIDELKKIFFTRTPKILDIGTGSGCIAITVKKEIPDAQVFALDISEAALETAQQNATQLQATVEFKHCDLLNEPIPVNGLDSIVSNPPYVRISESKEMLTNVLAYEPHQALFVPDDDALIFYKVIASKGYDALVNGGKILVEINEALGKETIELFEKAGYINCQLIQDYQHKNRIVTATKK